MRGTRRRKDIMRHIIIAIAITACTATPAKPGCGDGDLARINAAEQGQLAYECAGQGVDCPNRAAIHADYKQQREDWFLKCQP